MKIRTLIIDDEPIALEKLRAYVEKVPFLELVGECQSGLEAISLLAQSDVDVVFTDINMPDLSGMDFVKSLPSAPMVVFMTAYAQYAVDSYKLSAVDYILKPYSFADFQRAANKVLETYNARHRDITERHSEADSLFVKVDYRYVRIGLSTIRYIKGYGEYLQVFVEGSPHPLLTLSSFAVIKERLTDNFLQVHRSYIVNMNHVDHISRGRIVMDAETYIPVGDSYKTLLQEYLQNHSIGSSSRK